MPLGVFPVHNNVFKLGINGRSSTEGQMVVVKDLETFSPSIDATTEEWNPMDTAGWVRRAVTGKGLTFAFSGKRRYGDPGNDYVAGLLLATGQGVESVFRWDLPNGDRLTMDCIVSLTTPAGGDSTNIDNLEFEILSDGLPVYTANAALPELTFVCTDHATAGATQVASVSPVLTGGNAYFYKLNVGLPTVGQTISAALGWTSYTLSSAIPCANNNTLVLVETNAGVAVKAGSATTVVA